MAPAALLHESIIPTGAKPLARRPTLVRKRDDTDDDYARNKIPSSPGKKIKVSFDNDVEVRVMEEWGKAPEVIREEVKRGIERHAVGDDLIYDRMKEIYNARPTDEDAPTQTTLKNYTSALLSQASMLNRSCNGLVQTVLKSEWLERDEDYVAQYVKFLGHLISAQGTYMRDALGMLVTNLTYAVASDGRPQIRSIIPRSQKHARTHAALKYLLQLMPSASSVLQPVLVKAFPYHSDSKRAHLMYIRNLLKIIDYTPELRSEILGLITERLVKIDVQVQVDLEDLADEIGEGLVQDLPHLQSQRYDDMNNDEDTVSESDSDESLDPETQHAKEITANVEKIDVILDTLFTYYNPLFSGTPISVREPALDNLIAQFVTIILPTYRSRHTQFLIFHFAQTSPILIDNFVGACVHIAFDKGRPAISRQSAAAYLASFVARGIHVPAQIVQDVFDYIGNQLAIFRSEYEPTCRGPDLRRYSSYYALVQALLYIFCFRWRDLEAPETEIDKNMLSDDEEDEVDEQDKLEVRRAPRFLSGIKEILSSNAFSPLNPLKICSPAIVTEFARITHHLRVIYVFHILETNKRIRLSGYSTPSTPLSSGMGAELGGQRETALSNKRDESYGQLDGYFPFDPFHLPRSKRWVQGDYREWKGVPGLDDKEVEEGEEEGGADDSEEEDSEAGDEDEEDQQQLLLDDMDDVSDES